MTATSRVPARARRAAVALGTGLAVALVPLAAVSGPATATTTTPTAAPGCATGALPKSVQGKPAGFTRGLPAGSWVWHDRKGFHLRVTHDNKSKLIFSGIVRSSNKIYAQPFAFEKNDVLWRNSTHTAVRFTLRNYGAVDGIDFQTGCSKKVTLSLNVGAVKLAPTQIHIGAGNTNPAANPFAIIRHKPAPAPAPTPAG